MKFSEEQERMLRIALEKTKGIDDKLLKPANEALKESMLLTRLQAQWILFGSLAGLALVVKDYSDYSTLQNLLILVIVLLFLAMSTVFAWLTISVWANLYNSKFEFYSQFHTHEMRETQIWHKKLTEGIHYKQIQFPIGEIPKTMGKLQLRASCFLKIATCCFIVALTIGLFMVIQTQNMRDRIIPSISTEKIEPSGMETIVCPSASEASHGDNSEKLTNSIKKCPNE